MTIENQITLTEKRHSNFENELRKQTIPACDVFQSSDSPKPIVFESLESSTLTQSDTSLIELFPQSKSEASLLEGKLSSTAIKGKKVAILFSGGPAPGGHNVVVGVRTILGQDNTLYGIRKGPKGLIEGDLFEISMEDVNTVRNLGGFDYLGSDRTKIKTEEQFQRVKDTVKHYQLDGLVVIGGDDSNTNAAFLAEELSELGCQVIGVPKTIDGDLQVGENVPISFGFDTATKIYSEMVGNILQDTPSSQKYWHFIKLMGRSASHVALEVALQTKPMITLISEEIEQEKKSLSEIVNTMSEIILQRSAKQLNYGVVVIPEGLIEFIPECKQLISELNEKIGAHQDELTNKTSEEKEKLLIDKLSIESAQLLRSFPKSIKETLLMDRDAHGNLKVSQIPTEQLLVEMVSTRIKEMQTNSAKYFGADKIKVTEDELRRCLTFEFQANSHFFGYEGRCGAPTQFDRTYTYNLGLIAGSLILDGKTGYMAAISELDKGGKPLAISLQALLNKEVREGKESVVIKKALVELDSPAFQFFKKRRNEWWQEDVFSNPGPVQLWGPTANQLPFTVALNQGYKSLEFEIGQ